jgi:hypothetical protein
MSSAQKVKLIHVARRELELTEEAYRQILSHHAGVRSAKDLDDNGFKRVIDCMKALGLWVSEHTSRTNPATLETFRPSVK